MVRARRWGLSAFIGALAALPSTALAAGEPQPQLQPQPQTPSSPWSIDAAVALVSDYRFRGISQTEQEPAIQPELYISHESGLYAGIWASTIAPDGGDDIELVPSIGFAGSFGGFSLDVYAMWYAYPGTSGYDFGEIDGTLSTQVGAATLGIEFAYVPPQDNVGGLDNRYAALHGALPLAGTPLTASASIGFEDGAFADAKVDWSIGLAADLSGVALGIAYVDAAHHGYGDLADPTLVFSLRGSF